jgi:geranylgeranyl diphosphate synthase type II
MDGDGKVLSEQELTDIQSRKTGSLLASACDMGAIVGGATEQQRTAALQFGAVLGAAFQIRDDMLDVIADEDVLGKNIGSDEREGKSTFVTLWGLEKCRSAVSQLTEYAKEIVHGSFADSSELERLADMLTERVK